MIPEFDERGLLPPGVHAATWQELEERFGTSNHRRRLLGGLKRALTELARVGCRTAFIDGSFVTDKDVPGDYDACWEEAGVDPHGLDPVLLTFDNARSAQKAKYLGELFPASTTAESGPPFRDFFDFFQEDKETGKPKGILELDLAEFKP